VGNLRRLSARQRLRRVGFQLLFWWSRRLRALMTWAGQTLMAAKEQARPPTISRGQPNLWSAMKMQSEL